MVVQIQNHETPPTPWTRTTDLGSTAFKGQTCFDASDTILCFTPLMLTLKKVCLIFYMVPVAVVTCCFTCSYMENRVMLFPRELVQSEFNNLSQNLNSLYLGKNWKKSENSSLICFIYSATWSTLKFSVHHQE